MNPSTQPGGHWQYSPEAPDQRDQTSLTPGEDPQLQSVRNHTNRGATRSVTWTASEFIAHEKSFGWYAILAGGTVVASALIFLLTRDYITNGFILIAAILFGIEAGRKPNQMQYQIDDHGITLGNRFVPFRDFRSFSIVDDGAFASIVFLPLKRFALLTSAYIDPKDEDAIVEIVASSLPIEDHNHDIVERLMRRIRF